MLCKILCIHLRFCVKGATPLRLPSGALHYHLSIFALCEGVIIYVQCRLKILKSDGRLQLGDSGQLGLKKLSRVLPSTASAGSLFQSRMA
jgi:hypothetical protein